MAINYRVAVRREAGVSAARRECNYLINTAQRPVHRQRVVTLL
jgi:hypothetical protein